MIEYRTISAAITRTFSRFSICLKVALLVYRGSALISFRMLKITSVLNLCRRTCAIGPNLALCFVCVYVSVPNVNISFYTPSSTSSLCLLLSAWIMRVGE